ncbi:MAG: hypothetical protein WC314_23350 [Vulcanimicrobiota bacterium]
MSTRTSIRIGSILDSSMQERLPGYERFLEEYTSQYLLFGYRKPILGHYYAFVLFQASKTFGGLTCEVGLSRTKDFPYFRYYDQPSIGVGGFRARTTHVVKGLDAATTRMYSGPDVLLGHVMDLVSEAITAGNKLIEETIPRVAEQFKLWQPFYEEWVEAEKIARPNPQGLRYGSLIGEGVARTIIHDCLRGGRLDSFLGTLKFRYRDAAFMNCHVYLLAKALAFEEPPDDREFQELIIDPGQHPDKILFDAIGPISSRLEQPEAIELSSSVLRRVPEWAFIRSFAALEALFDSPTVSLDEVRSSVKEPAAKPVATAPVGLSLDELYGDAPAVVAEGGGLGGPPPEPALSPEPTRSGKGKDRLDPFESFEEYLDGSVQPVQAQPDTFDFLGSQLGL